MNVLGTPRLFMVLLRGWPCVQAWGVGPGASFLEPPAPWNFLSARLWHQQCSVL